MRTTPFGIVAAATLCLVVSTLGSVASAAVVASHVGTTDPATEGWNAPPPAAGVAVGPIVDGGTAAWSVDDDATANGSTALYTFDVAAGDVGDGSSRGWVLRARVRAIDIPDVPDGSVDVIYRDGATSWELQLGNDGGGDPIAFLRTNSSVPQTGVAHTATGAGNVYVLYELVYDPVALSADLFVNGTEVLSDYPGFALAQPPRVFFGSGTSADTGHGNYASVEWIVPDPTPGLSGLPLFALLALMTVLLGLFGRRLRLSGRPTG